MFILLFILHDCNTFKCLQHLVKIWCQSMNKPTPLDLNSKTLCYWGGIFWGIRSLQHNFWWLYSFSRSWPAMILIKRQNKYSLSSTRSDFYQLLFLTTQNKSGSNALRMLQPCPKFGKSKAITLLSTFSRRILSIGLRLTVFCFWGFLLYIFFFFRLSYSACASGANLTNMWKRVIGIRQNC